MLFPRNRCPPRSLCFGEPRTRVAAKLDAVPYDDEELTASELREVREARSEPGISWSDAEAKVKLGLTQ